MKFLFVRSFQGNFGLHEFIRHVLPISRKPQVVFGDPRKGYNVGHPMMPFDSRKFQGTFLQDEGCEKVIRKPQGFQMRYRIFSGDRELSSSPRYKSKVGIILLLENSRKHRRKSAYEAIKKIRKSQMNGTAISKFVGSFAVAKFLGNLSLSEQILQLRENAGSLGAPEK